MVYQQQLSFPTAGQGDMHDITPQVAAIVTISTIKTGTVNVFNIGSTAAIGTIEFEPGLQQDLPRHPQQIDPPEPRIRARADVARRQWPFAFAGHPAGPRRSRCRLPRASRCSAPGSKSSTSNAMCADASARWSLLWQASGRHPAWWIGIAARVQVSSHPRHNPL